MAIRQVRMFVHSAEPPDGWVATVIGKVIVPITAQYQASLRWFWFSRYIDTPEAGGDTDINVIPADYKVGVHRSVRFRFEIDDPQQAAYEAVLRQLMATHNYAYSDILDYDKVGDTGGNRFLGTENRLAGRDVQRAELVTQMYQSVSKLVIDALVGPDGNGRYRIESNDHHENPDGSTFQSVMHLFCNISEVPVNILLRVEDAYGISAATYWTTPRQVLPINWRGHGRYPVQF